MRKETLRQKGDEEEHLEIYGGLREDIGMKTYLYGQMEYAKNLELRFQIGERGPRPRRTR